MKASLPPLRSIPILAHGLVAEVPHTNKGNEPSSLNLLDDSTRIQDSLYSQVSCTRPMIAPPLASTGQSQSYSSKSLPSPSVPTNRTVVPNQVVDPDPSKSNDLTIDPPAPTTEDTKDAGAETFAQSQYQIMTLNMEQLPVLIPVDVQAASEIAGEKRKRNATACRDFRHRRKANDQAFPQRIAGLKAQLKQTTEERDRYLRERDHLSNHSASQSLLYQEAEDNG